MPELPEVETIRSQLEPQLVGRQIQAVWTFAHAKFQPGHLAVGTTISGMGRRGKYLLIELDDDRELVVHLGMTGLLFVGANESQPLGVAAGDAVRHPHDRARFSLDDGSFLTFRDARRFGRILVVPVGDYRSAGLLGRMGPEPLSDDFTADTLVRGLAGSRRPLKSVLLSQELVAGLGNIYIDEALWEAQIAPVHRGGLRRDRAERLAEAIKTILAASVARGGTTLRDYRDSYGATGTNQRHLSCYGRKDEPCLRCGQLLSGRRIDGRSTVWCTACQR